MITDSSSGINSVETNHFGQQSGLLQKIMDMNPDIENEALSLEHIARYRGFLPIYRCAAIYRLVSNKLDSAKPLLNQLVDEPNEEVRRTAAEWLAHLEPAGKKSLSISLDNLSAQIILPVIEAEILKHLNTGFDELKGLGQFFLLKAFQRMGVFRCPGESYNKTDLQKQLSIIPLYQRLYEVMLNILTEAGFIRYDKENILTEPSLSTNTDYLSTAGNSFREKYPEIATYGELLQICSDCYPEILRGERPAVEIMFPDSSQKLVESIYRGNPCSDYFNRSVALSVKTYLQARIPHIAQGEKIRILEIGAGTGGTAGIVSETIQEYGEHTEYFYTDISVSFTRYGKKQYGNYPFLKFGVLNIETDPEEQGYLPGNFDVIIATNVLHATRNMRTTLGNVKLLLKNKGWLILNELTTVPEFFSLTFGLLNGWWVFEDEDIRLKGSPLLSTDNWKKLLDEQGFRCLLLTENCSVTNNPAFPQHIIIAESDGKRTGNRKQETGNRERLSCEEELNFIEEKITDSLAASLQIRGQEFDINTSYTEFGVGSMLGIEIVNRLNDSLSIQLVVTDLFNYPTIRKLSEYIYGVRGSGSEVRGDESKSREIFYSCPEPRTPNPEPLIAVIGMAGKFPDADDITEFWENLVCGRDSVREIPGDRWDINGAMKNVSCKQGGFLSDMDRFDPLFFGISPKEAALTDPQHRLFLQEAWHAFEDAGYSPDDMNGAKCGVFVGFNFNHYGNGKTFAEPHFFTGNAEAILAARISYILNLKGPSLAVNSACSASLAAVHLACESIRSGTCETAIAGGVQVMATEQFYLLADSIGMLSPSGRCSTFDNCADGISPAEGVGAVMLKSLDSALRDGDHIYGVIKGSGINQDGKTNGITAPNGLSQTALFCDVYERYHISPETISYVEAHGTGTELGDPIEVHALSDAFRKYCDRRQYCAIGSVKTNIGHTLGAAGIASLIKVMLCLKHRKLVPSLHFREENRHISFKKTPFYVNTEFKDWETCPNIPRRAAISSFGFSGTNVHIVAEEVRGQRFEVRGNPEPQIIVLSAKNEERLMSYAKKLAVFLEKDEVVKDYLLRDIAYTLQTGRRAMEERLAAVVSTIEELREKLIRYIHGKRDTDRLYQGNIRTAESEKVCFAQSADPAQLWVSGKTVDWKQLHSDPKPRRISLPGYPFAKERYWLPEQTCELKITSYKNPAESVSQRSGDPCPDKSLLLNHIRRDLIQIISEILEIGEDNIFAEDNIGEYGFDSITLTEFAGMINGKYNLDAPGTRITPAAFFEHSSVALIAAYLLEKNKTNLLQYYPDCNNVSVNIDVEVNEDGGLDLPCRRVGVTHLANSCEPVAIIGMSGILPQSEDLETFWTHLENGDDLITEIPQDRWDWKAYYGDPVKEINKTDVKWGGFIKEMDQFDASFFGISPREAELTDPQHRVFLQTAFHCIEDAGIKASDLSGKNVGVFVGVTTTDYNDLLQAEGISIEAYMVTGLNSAMLANRVSYLLNLQGPSESINTACSSSLVAIHRAVETLRRGECDLAIAGGVNAMFSPLPYIALSKAGMLSKDGRCKTFDKNANGYARGEGAGAVLLKPLHLAEADGDMIYAVIRGISANHGGRANSLTAPNPNAQAALLVSAYTEAGIAPDTVSYIEAHGTGTELGDPIEINGLKKAFSELYQKQSKTIPKQPHCGLGSVKTNIGHLEAAAGIAGVLKILLAMKYRKLPASIHFREMNPYIELEETPFYIVSETRAWEPSDSEGLPIPRIAGISSFGAGGSNVHIVLEEWVRGTGCGVRGDLGPHLIVLSAKNEERLKVYARNVADFLKRFPSDYSLSQIAFTLQTGREAMPYRMAAVVSGIEELVEKLESYSAGSGVLKSAPVYIGNVKKQDQNTALLLDGKEGEEFVKIIIRNRNIDKLARLWVNGAEIDWNLLYSEGKPRRVSLPVYPFEKKSYRIPKPAEKQISVHKQVAKLHPMIDRNISTFQEQKFAVQFTGKEFYLSDHRIAGQKVLPGVAYIEMARAAGELAGERKVRTIRNIVWVRPIQADQPREAQICLYPNDDRADYEICVVEDGERIVCSQGRLFYETEHIPEPEAIDIEAVKKRCTHIKAGTELYPLFDSLGFGYGPGFQSLSLLSANGTEAVADLILPRHLEQTSEQFVLHPALMDGVLQTVVGLLQNGNGSAAYLPFSIGEVEIIAPLPSECYAYISQSGEKNRSFAMRLTDTSGNILVRMENLSIRPLKREGIREEDLSPLTPSQMLSVFRKLADKCVNVREAGRLMGMSLN